MNELLSRYWEDIRSEVRAAIALQGPVLVVGGRLTGKSQVVSGLYAASEWRTRSVPAGELAAMTSSWEEGEVLVVDSMDEAPYETVRAGLQAALDKGAWVVGTCTPELLSAFRRDELSTRCELVAARPVTGGFLEGPDAELLLRHTGGHPAFVETVLIRRTTEVSMDAAIERAALKLRETYGYLYGRLNEAQRQLLSALVVGSAEERLNVREVQLVAEDLERWLLVRREEGRLVVAGQGLEAWLREFVCLPSTRSNRGRPRDAGGDLPLVEAQACCVLHLSDLQFGPRHIFSEPEGTFGKLRDDLADLMDRGIRRPDVVIVSGDIAERGYLEEYEHARRFLEELARFLELATPRWVVLAPGNHDVCWPLAEAKKAVENLRVFRMAPFTSFRRLWYGEDDWKLYGAIGSFGRFDYPEVGFSVAAFDTNERIDHESQEPWLDVDLIQQAVGRSPIERDRAVLAAVMHHGPLEHQDGQETLTNATDVRKTLELHGFRLCFHGHVHEGGVDTVNNLWLLAAGSLSVKAPQLAGSEDLGNVRHHYQIVTWGALMDGTREGIVYPRAYDPYIHTKAGRGRWVGHWVDDGRGGTTFFKRIELAL